MPSKPHYSQFMAWDIGTHRQITHFNQFYSCKTLSLQKNMSLNQSNTTYWYDLLEFEEINF